MSEDLALLGGEPVRQDPYPEHTTMIDEAEEQQVLEVLRGGHLSGFSARPGERFLGGSKVRQLENGFADHFKVKHAVSFNSATSALHGIVAAAGIGPGDEVIVPPTTMSATATSVVMQNGIPVFADIEDKTFGLDPADVQRKITPRTKAILSVNLFGHPSRLSELKALADAHGLILLEDNAQAPGAVVDGVFSGTVGKMGVQSLNYHKGIQTGEGGMALTDDDDAARHLQMIRNHGEVVIGQTQGWSRKDLVNLLGWNYRLTEVQAAIGLGQLPKLEQLNAIRVSLANMLARGLNTFDFLVPPENRSACSHVYYIFPMLFSRKKAGIAREVFVKAMQAEGISIGQGYVRPIYLEPMYQEKVGYGIQGCPFSCPYYKGEVSYEKGLCPTAESLHFERLLTTDICKYPNTEKEVEEFLRAVEKVAANMDKLTDVEA